MLKYPTTWRFELKQADIHLKNLNFATKDTNTPKTPSVSFQSWLFLAPPPSRMKGGSWDNFLQLTIPINSCQLPQRYRTAINQSLLLSESNQKWRRLLSGFFKTLTLALLSASNYFYTYNFPTRSPACCGWIQSSFKQSFVELQMRGRTVNAARD